VLVFRDTVPGSATKESFLELVIGEKELET
jgi:hypothetical protein